MKECVGCKQSKQLDQFDKNKKGKDGLNNFCRDCRIIERNRDSSKYGLHKYHAKERGIKHELTFEQWKSFKNLPCFYCGTDIEGVSLDRINNDKHYTISNVKQCCKPCNSSKKDKTLRQFISYRMDILQAVQDSL